MNPRYCTTYLTEAEYDEWGQFVSKSPQGSIYSTPQYLSSLCAVTNATFRILAVRRGDELVGGVGLYEVKSPGGWYVSPRLLLYYNGILLRHFETKYPSMRTSRYLEILDAIEQTVSRSGYARVILKNHNSLTDARLFQSRAWTALPTYTYVIPLADLGLLWNRVEQNLRRLINRCSQEGIQFTEDDDFDSFYKMHEDTVERKGAALYLPRDLFRRYFESLRSQQLCRIYQARLPNGRPIASQLVLLGPFECAHTVSAAADKEFLNLGANAFLRWKVFETLSKMGYSANDLTDAALNPVTHFKSQLGGDLQTCLALVRPDTLSFRAYRKTRDLLDLGPRGFRKLARIYLSATKP